jgi:hypothetical protein
MSEFVVPRSIPTIIKIFSNFVEQFHEKRIGESHCLRKLNDSGRGDLLTGVASKVFDAARHQCRPARLMRGAEATSVVAVEVFMKEHKVLPVRILPIQGTRPVAWSGSRRIGKEKVRQTSREFAGNLIEIHPDTGACRTFDDKAIAIKVVVAFKGFKQ